MMDEIDQLTRLSNFNLIKYTGHYVLTIDRGFGKPVIFEGDSIEEVLDQFKLQGDKDG